MSVMSAAAWTATAAVASAGASIYSATQAPDAPQLGTPPAPSSYFSYDENGNLLNSYEYDEESNSYSFKPAPLTSKEKQDRQIRGQIKSRMLANLNETPADRLAAYDEFEQTYADVLRRPVEKQFERITGRLSENLERTGRTGSRADVDLTSELAGRRLETEQDIASEAALAKSGEVQRDRNYWQNLLNLTESGERTDKLLLAEREGRTANIARGGSQDILNRYNVATGNKLTEFDLDLEKSAARTGAFANVASGAANIYARGLGGNDNTFRRTVQGRTI